MTDFNLPPSKSPNYRKQWRLDQVRGIDRTTDAGPVREHVLGLLRAGLTRRSVAEVARCSPTVLGRLLAGQPTMQVRTARRLLAVSVERVAARQSPHGHVPAVGSRRRIQALLVLGWRHTDITERIRAHGAATQSQLVLHQTGERLERRTGVVDVGWWKKVPCRPVGDHAWIAWSQEAGWGTPGVRFSEEREQ